MRLQRVESAKLVEFPETVEGFFGKVRWYIPFSVLPSIELPMRLIKSVLSRRLCTVVFAWCALKVDRDSQCGF